MVMMMSMNMEMLMSMVKILMLIMMKIMAVCPGLLMILILMTRFTFSSFSLREETLETSPPLSPCGGSMSGIVLIEMIMVIIMMIKVVIIIIMAITVMIIIISLEEVRRKQASCHNGHHDHCQAH